MPGPRRWTLDIQNSGTAEGTLLRIYDPSDELVAAMVINSTEWHTLATRDGHSSVLLTDSDNDDWQAARV